MSRISVRFLIHSVFLLCVFCLPLAGQNLQHVILDPGHGGKDKGAIWGGVRESDLNLKVARKMETLLKARGIGVSMTRRSDQFISLSRRAQIANRYRNAIFVSIHFNASTHTSVRGIETYYASDKGKKLATAIQTKLISKLRAKDRKVRKAGQYAVLKLTNCPAVLVECGYISNAYERKRCNSSWYQSLCASAIVEGIIQYR